MKGPRLLRGAKSLFTPPPPPMKYWSARLWVETKEKCRFCEKTENKSPVENYNANLLQRGREDVAIDKFCFGTMANNIKILLSRYFLFIICYYREFLQISLRRVVYFCTYRFVKCAFVAIFYVVWFPLFYIAVNVSCNK